MKQDISKAGKKIVTLADVGEREWLRRVRRWFAPQARGLELGIGDDAALIKIKERAGPLIVSTDALIEGVHFKLDWTPPRALGAKALAVNLSDLAAMAARPLAAFLCLGVPPQTPLQDLRDFFMGLRAEARRWGCPLAGGDLTRAPQWTLAVTVLGQPFVARRPALRSAARPGQRLYVTGQPGESAAGLDALRAGIAAPHLIHRHNRPTPRLREAELLAHLCPDLALIDVSDGIWNDAGQLAEASRVRINLNAAAFWATQSMQKLNDQIREIFRDRLLKGCHLNNGIRVNPVEWVLFGGEDYELLFATAAPPDKIAGVFKKAGCATTVREIGGVVPGRGVHLIIEGRELKLDDQTFRHF